MIMIAFDFETTGLTLHPSAPITKQPRAIEFGGVLMNEKGEVLEEASILINPQQSLTEEITKITGLTDADLKDAPIFSQVLPQLCRLFGEASVVMAHNLPFDKSILRGELARIDCHDFPWPSTEICTVQLYADVWGRNPRLVELYQHVMGVPLAQTHRALDDVKAMVDIIKKEKLWELIN